MLDALIDRRRISYRPQKDRNLNKELAITLFNGLGYEDALRRAKSYHWEDVAKTIHFLASKKGLCS